jgi:dipeptidyl aminopeptidase/acylaminoacyl peptidase
MRSNRYECASRRKRSVTQFGAPLILAAYVGLHSHCAQADDRLPARFDAVTDAAHGEAPRPWSTADIVEVRRITHTAISDRTRQVAFVVKQSFVDSDDIRYGLYLVEPQGRSAKKLVEAAYLDQLSWHPASDLWTVRGDFGSGIQLYDVDSSGKTHSLVVNPRMLMVGGTAESVVAGAADEGLRQTGIASYQWAPDGSALWYSIYRVRDPVERQGMAMQGVVFDDREMDIHAFLNDPTMVLGNELHVLRPVDGNDRTVLFVPGGLRAGVMFSRPDGSANWESDSQHIQYTLWLSKPDASVDFSRWSIDVASGVAHQLAGNTLNDVFDAVPAPDGRGYLTVKTIAESHDLMQVQDGAEVVKDYGKVDFLRIGTGFGSGAWSDLNGHRLILGVSYSNHHGLVTIPASRAGRSLEQVADDLNRCSFVKDISYGVCVRESVRTAPELVEVWMKHGTVVPAIRINPRYSHIRPLRIEPAIWTNRYGNRSDGYITYPGSYVDGQKYPTIVVTHDVGARNDFCNAGFQWEFPIQVLADRGYLVLSVNEPQATAKTLAASKAREGLQAKQSVADVQFAEAFNAVATMEAALTAAVENGLADPEKTGIAGYSRGAEIVEWVMTQSKLFHAAIEGDAGGLMAGHYGLAWTPMRAYYRQLYGGSPFDQGAAENHLRLSFSFRSKEVAGPYLQLFSKGAGVVGLELHALLRDAGIPTDLIFFPNESHIFWNPRHQSAAMEHSIDWFDYWLLNKRNPEPGYQDQYARWDAMASTWKGSKVQ